MIDLSWQQVVLMITLLAFCGFMYIFLFKMLIDLVKYLFK
jgi:hypothetical protein